MTQQHTPHGGHGGHGAHRGHRTHKFDPANVERLLGDERRRQLPPEDTLRAAGVAPGQTVVDLGCGPGYFTLPAAALAGSTGRIYAVDVQRELLDVCRRRADEAGLANVETVHSEESRVPLPDACADRVFAAFVLHETDDPAAFLREAARLLKPGGVEIHGLFGGDCSVRVSCSALVRPDRIGGGPGPDAAAPKTGEPDLQSRRSGRLRRVALAGRSGRSGSATTPPCRR